MRLHKLQRRSNRWTSTGRAVVLLSMFAYVWTLLPIANSLVLLLPFAPPRLPIIDNSPFNWSSSDLLTVKGYSFRIFDLLTPTAVLAFVAGYFQSRWNHTIVRGGVIVREGTRSQTS